LIIFLSGGSAITETCLEEPDVMLSFYVNISQKTGKPDSRIVNLMNARRKAKGLPCKLPKKKKSKSKPSK
jgi:hypothetical protein